MHLPSGIQCKASLLSLSVSEASAPCWSWKHWNQQENQVELQIANEWTCKFGSPSSILLMSWRVLKNPQLSSSILFNSDCCDYWICLNIMYLLTGFSQIIQFCTFSYPWRENLPSTLLLLSRDCLQQCAERYHCQIPYSGHQHLFEKQIVITLATYDKLLTEFSNNLH